jgi:phenylpyruvate tautomerase PptA (4-oxalocrotonate tautomerase family)
MPLLQFYTNVNQLTQAEKEELAKTLTDRYATRMPAFFVDIVFNEVSNSHMINT